MRSASRPATRLAAYPARFPETIGVACQSVTRRFIGPNALRRRAWRDWWICRAAGGSRGWIRTRSARWLPKSLSPRRTARSGAPGPWPRRWAYRIRASIPFRRATISSPTWYARSKSNDPKFEEKFWDIIGLYLDPPEKALILCCDERSQCQALERTQPGLPLGMGDIRTKTHDYKRHGTITLFARGPLPLLGPIAAVVL